jgi:putative ABC transport system substrate-binding protein
MITGADRQSPRIVAFFDELKGFGFIEGQNVEIVAGGFDVRDDQSAGVAATLVKSHPDVIFCVGDPVLRAAQESTRTIPIVGMASDMVAAGLVRSFAHPGGNVTGLSILATELDGKRQEILMEAVPGARKIAILTASVPRDPRIAACFTGGAA